MNEKLALMVVAALHRSGLDGEVTARLGRASEREFVGRAEDLDTADLLRDAALMLILGVASQVCSAGDPVHTVSSHVLDHWGKR